MLSFIDLKVNFGCFIFVLHLNCKVSGLGVTLLFYIATSTVASWSLAVTLGNLKKKINYWI